MAIKDLNEDDLLEFLMTSEFDDNFSPDEVKYLLKKWRYFYRLYNGRVERFKSDKEFEIKKLEDDILSNKLKIDKYQIEIASKDNEIHLLQTRKLTWKERIKGKIIKNEN